MIKCILLISIVAATAAFGCGPARSEQPKAVNTAPPAESVAATPRPAETPAAPEEKAGRSARAECQATRTGEMIVVKEQTFDLNFEPFKDGCFVTTRSREYSDPPLDSRFDIYRNGKRVFEFPDRFNGVTFGCWVTAVAFQDLNDDKFTDAVVTAKCQAKMGDYNENMVYVNNGKEFTTRPDANGSLNEYSTVRDVVEFVKENRSMFF